MNFERGILIGLAIALALASIFVVMYDRTADLEDRIDLLQSQLGIRVGTVDTANIADGAVTGVKIAPFAITSEKLTGGSVTSGIIADGTITDADVSVAGISAGKIIISTSHSTTYLSDWIQPGTDKIAGGVIQGGTITADKIVADAVSSTQIADGAITSDKIADNAVTTPKIAPDIQLRITMIAGTSITENQVVCLWDETDFTENVWPTNGDEDAAITTVGVATHDAELGEEVSIIVFGRATVTAASDMYPGYPVAGVEDGEVIDVINELMDEPWAVGTVGWPLEYADEGDQVEIFVALS